MRFLAVATLALMASVSAQNLTGVPSCADSCLSTAVAGCTGDDCNCLDDDGFKQFTNCSYSACSGSDYSSIFKIFDQVCSDDQPVVTFYYSNSMWYTLEPTTTESHSSTATNGSSVLSSAVTSKPAAATSSFASSSTASSKPAPTSSSSASSYTVGKSVMLIVAIALVGVVGTML
ncbi:hypothetical protein V1505DRAFT_238036 [Lipomyces doorenjongii]